MPSRLHNQQVLALLIDAENARCSLTPQLLRRAACYGDLAVKRAYADWTRPDMRGRQALLHRYAIEPVHYFRYATGKNSADMSLAVDAMALANTGQFDGVGIASSDSDFTPLAIQLRMQGLRVYGFGEQHTPMSFVQACTRFIYVETLVGHEKGPFQPPEVRRRRTAPGPACSR